MHSYEIESEIRSRLDGQTKEYACGMDRKSWNECIAMVQRDEHTIQDVADLISTWAAWEGASCQEQ